MSNVTRIFAALAVGLALAGCAANAKDAAAPDGASKPASATASRLATVRAQYPHYAAAKSQDSAALFDQNKVQRFDLWLEDADLAALNADPTAEKYVEGALVYNGRVVPAVGIRYKGKRGAFFGCVDGPNPFMPSGAKSCTKLSMKLKFDWTDSDQTFYGVKKLNFQSNNLDPSMMRDRLGFWLFNRFGVAAPRAVHANIYINGQYNGIFTMIEEVDSRFTKRAFQGGGNLYKEMWPVDHAGKRRPDAEYVASLRSNAKKAQVADFARFAADIEAMERDQPRAKIDATMRRWFNVDTLIRYAVVDRSIAADDGVFHWWCFEADKCYNQNFFWYQDPKSGKLSLIPWDQDLSFENLGEQKNPVTAVVSWNKIEKDCAPFSTSPFPIQQRSAPCDKLIHAIVQYDKEFAALRAEFRRKHYNVAAMNALIDRWAAQIEQSVTEASAANADQIKPEDWKKAVAKLKADIAYSLR